MWTMNFLMFKLVLEKAEATICWITKKAREFQKNIYFCIIDYTKAFDCVDHNKLWKVLQEVGIPDDLTCLLRNLYAGQEATLRTEHEQQTGSKLGKEYIKVVYYHPAYLIVCRMCHERCQAEWSSSRNEDCREMRIRKILMSLRIWTTLPMFSMSSLSSSLVSTANVA